LTRKRRLAKEDPESILYLSPISLWESCLLIEDGRLPAMGSLEDWVAKAQEALSVREAPLSFAIAARSRRISLSHQDSADRFIAATSLEMKIPLVASDERLLGSPELSCVR